MMELECEPPGTDTGLADRLKARTAGLHRMAERSGIIQDLLRGRASLEAYALLLRNLVPVYEALEAGLDALPAGAPAKPLALPDVYRSAALRSDLDHLAGSGWAERLPLLPGGRRYAERVARASSLAGETLIAHAYVRYLGDLNGGQVLKRLLAKHFAIGAAGLNFYDFPDLADPRAFANDFRAAIDTAELSGPAAEAVLIEGVVAFRLNIEVSDEVGRAVFGFAKAENGVMASVAQS